MLLAGTAQAAPLTLGIVLDQHESLADPATTQRYRAFVKDVEKSIGEPVRMQYYTRGFAALKQARDGNLDMVFGPAQVIANLGRFKFEPLLKSDETIAAAFVAGPNFQGHAGREIRRPARRARL